MKMRYCVRRVINCQNFENIAIEFEMEGEDMAEVVAKVEAFIEDKEAEIRSQLKGE